MRNPIYLVAPGARGEVALADDVHAHIVRGMARGPIVWAWAPRGDGDPSMAQALGELRDRLDPRTLRGAVGLLLDGPLIPVGREQYPWAAQMRAICEDTAAVVLLESMLPGYRAAPHVAVDLEDRPSRAIARALGSSYIAPHAVMPPPNRAILSAPTAVWLDGEYERLERRVIDRAGRALRSLLSSLGMIAERPFAPAVRVVLKTVTVIDAPGPGVVEPALPPGALVRAGEAAAYVGEPGLRTRQTLHAPTTGVILYARSGAQLGGSVVGIGKLKRALPAVIRAAAEGQELRARRPSGGGSGIDVGWCERVSLPELGVVGLKAKIDTGARTSALHVLDMKPAGVTGEGRPLLDVEILADDEGSTRIERVEVREFTWVRDSGGHADRRPVIETALRLGEVERRVRVSLTDRGDMLFPMLVGRTALGPDIRVHPSRRFLLR